MTESITKTFLWGLVLTLTFTRFYVYSDTVVANSYTEYGCNSYNGWYSDGQCVTGNSGASKRYECQDDGYMLLNSFDDGECYSNVSSTLTVYSSVECESDQEP